MPQGSAGEAVNSDPSVSARLDAPHEMVAGEAKDESEILAACAGRDPELAGEQIQNQANQLAGRLREQRQQLQARQARLNARVAQLDHEQRASRLWLQQQTEQLALRSAQLDGQAQELRRQRAEFVRQKAIHEKNLAEGQQQLKLQEAAVNHRQTESETAATKLQRNTLALKTALQRLRQKQHALAEREKTWQQQRLADGQRLGHVQQLADTLRGQLAALHRERVEFESEQQARCQKTQSQRQAIAESLWRTRREQQTRAAQQEGRTQSLLRRQTELSRLDERVAALLQQVMELQMTAQQAWTQLSRLEEPHRLNRAFRRAQSELTDHFGQRQAALDEASADAQSLLEQLDRRSQAVRRQQDELASWFQQQRNQMKQMAASLTARQKALERQAENQRVARHWWDRQRDRQAQALAALESLNAKKEDTPHTAECLPDGSKHRQAS